MTSTRRALRGRSRHDRLTTAHHTSGGVIAHAAPHHRDEAARTGLRLLVLLGLALVLGHCGAGPALADTRRELESRMVREAQREREGLAVGAREKGVGKRGGKTPPRSGSPPTLAEAGIAGRAKENMRSGGGSGPSGRQNSDNPIDTKREIAKAAGVSHDTIAKAKERQRKAGGATPVPQNSAEAVDTRATVAIEIRARAERRLGQLWEEQKRAVGAAKGGQPYQSTGVRRTPVDEQPPSLAAAGIDKDHHQPKEARNV